MSANASQILNLNNINQINIILESPASDRMIGHLGGLRQGAQSKEANGTKSLLTICDILVRPETK